MTKNHLVNVGAGSFHHKDWINLDKISEFYRHEQAEGTIHWDLFDLAPLPFPDDSVKLVYSSHVIEHVTDPAVMHFFRESLRVLEPKGGLRIRCPDVAKYFEAYSESRLVGFAVRDYGDKDCVTYREYRDLPAIKGVSQQQRFLWTFARQASIHHNRATNHLTDREVDCLFTNKPLKEALDECTKRCSLAIQQIRPEDHINWWTHEKLGRFLKIAGFSGTIKSHRGRSVFREMRSEAGFTEGNGISLYMEAIK